MNIVLRIIRSLLLNVWSFFRFSLNFDPVKKISENTISNLYFNKEGDYSEENACDNEVFHFTILHNEA